MFLLSFILLGLSVIYSVWKDSNFILGLKTISYDDYEKIIHSKSIADLDVDILFKDKYLPVVENDYYYLTQSVSNNWQGMLKLPGDYIYRIISPVKSKKELMSSNEPLIMLVYNNEYYDLKYIVVSGLPVVHMQVTEGEDLILTGNLTVYDNASGGREGVITAKTYGLRAHKRGGVSRNSPKTSYKVNLLDQNGEKKDASLLNMRNDNDWILNPAFLDNSRMREKIAYDLWNKLSNRFNHTLEYCELIISVEGEAPRYNGVYLLQEPVDLKTFESTYEDSFTFSIRGWYERLTEMMLYEEDAKDTLLQQEHINVELAIDKYVPEQIDDVLEVFKYIKNIEYKGKYNISQDAESLENHTLLLNLVMALDNTYKNQKFCAVKENDDIVLYKTAWDLDISMMNEQTTHLNQSIDRIIYDDFYKDQILAGNLNEADMRKKYFEIREKCFNTDYLNKKIDEYYNVLISTGAFARDADKWDVPELKSSCDYLKVFFRDRIDALDNYYRGILQ